MILLGVVAAPDTRTGSGLPVELLVFPALLSRSHLIGFSASVEMFLK